MRMSSRNLLETIRLNLRILNAIIINMLLGDSSRNLGMGEAVDDAGREEGAEVGEVDGVDGFGVIYTGVLGGEDETETGRRAGNGPFVVVDAGPEVATGDITVLKCAGLEEVDKVVPDFELGAAGGHGGLEEGIGRGNDNGRGGDFAGLLDAGILAGHGIDDEGCTGGESGVGYDAGVNFPKAVNGEEEVLLGDPFSLVESEHLAGNSCNYGTLAEVGRLPLLLQVLVDIDDMRGIDIDELGRTALASVLLNSLVIGGRDNIKVRGSRPVQVPGGLFDREDDMLQGRNLIDLGERESTGGGNKDVWRGQRNDFLELIFFERVPEGNESETVEGSGCIEVRSLFQISIAKEYIPKLRTKCSMSLGRYVATLFAP